MRALVAATSTPLAPFDAASIMGGLDVARCDWRRWVATESELVVRPLEGPALFWIRGVGRTVEEIHITSLPNGNAKTSAVTADGEVQDDEWEPGGACADCGSEPSGLGAVGYYPCEAPFENVDCMH